MENKILVAFDDSENSMKAVKAVSNSFSRDQKITLFSVVPSTEAICRMNSPELTPHFLSQQGVFCAMEEKNIELLNEAQQKAKALLLRKGFLQENITLKIEKAKRGIARDILGEARSGYSTIVLGRRGMSSIKEFFLGSVSQKVVSGAKNISILIVD